MLPQQSSLSTQVQDDLLWSRKEVTMHKALRHTLFVSPGRKELKNINYWPLKTHTECKLHFRTRTFSASDPERGSPQSLRPWRTALPVFSAPSLCSRSTGLLLSCRRADRRWSLESQGAEDRAKGDKGLSPDQHWVDRHKQQIWLIVSTLPLSCHPQKSTDRAMSYTQHINALFIPRLALLSVYYNIKKRRATGHFPDLKHNLFF